MASLALTTFYTDERLKSLSNGLLIFVIISIEGIKIANFYLIATLPDLTRPLGKTTRATNPILIIYLESSNTIPSLPKYILSFIAKSAFGYPLNSVR